MNKILLAVAVALGWLFAYVDSRPTWDDTGILVGAMIISCAVLGVLRPRQAWLSAVCAGIWIPLLGIIMSGNFSSLVALLFAFVGAYLGVGMRHLWSAANARS
jgi:hypothetical protein